jgi:hypothetical protein
MVVLMIIFIGIASVYVLVKISLDAKREREKLLGDIRRRLEEKEQEQDKLKKD